MELNKITQEEVEEKSVVGMAEVPGLPAEEMQYRIEQLVREIAIPKINEVIEYIVEKVAKNEDLENLLFESGNVTSVFGRAGAVVAKAEITHRKWSARRQKATQRNILLRAKTRLKQKTSERRKRNIFTEILPRTEKSEAQTEWSL